MELMKKCVDKYHHYPEEMNPKYRWDNQFCNQVVDLIEVLTAFVRFGDECEIQLPPRSAAPICPILYCSD